MSDDQEKDPMLFGNEAEQAAYRNDIMRQVRETIAEDRKARRSGKQRETPAVIVGGIGIPGGLNESLP